MNPLRVKARNCRTYEQFDWEIPVGLTAIVGANGAGKSTLVNAIDTALFAERGELGKLLTVGADEIEIQLEFEHGGSTYRSRRQLRAGKSATLDLEVLDVGLSMMGDGTSWEPLTRENGSATQAVLERILGLSRGAARASWFLRQADGGAFTEVDPAVRKGLLAEILGLDVWERMLSLVKADLRASEDELVQIRTRLEAAEMTVAGKADLVSRLQEATTASADAEAQVVKLEAEMEAAREKLAANQAAAERKQSAVRDLEVAKGEEARLAVSLQEAQGAAGEIAHRREELAENAEVAATIPGLEARVAEVKQARDAAIAAASQKTEARRVAESLAAEEASIVRDLDARQDLHRRGVEQRQHLQDAAAGTDRCTLCEQTLGAEGRAASIQNLTIAIDDHEKHLADLRARHAAAAEKTSQAVNAAAAIEIPDAPEGDFETPLATARAARERRAVIAAQIEGLQEKASRVPSLTLELAEAKGAVTVKDLALAEASAGVGDIDALQADVARIHGTASTVRGELLQRQAAIARINAELERVTAAETQIAEASERRTSVQTLINELKVAERAYGRDGIPALIVEAVAIPQIEVEANRILKDLDTSYQVELRTQALTKKGDLRDALAIVIHNGPESREYESYSEGEKTRLNLALRIALARLLAHRRGAESRLLVVDEPEFLDEAGVSRLVDVLRGLEADFDRVILVSHHPAAAASCPQQIQVTKDGDRSRIADTEPVEVAA